MLCSHKLRAALGAASVLSLFAYSAALAQTPDARTPEVIAIQTGLDQACLPALENPGHGTPKIAGLKQDDGGIFLPISGNERLNISPPDSVNPTVCIMTLSFPVGQRQGVLTLLNAWSAAHHLKAVKVDEKSQGSDDQRWTSTWAGQTPRGAMAIAFSADHPLNADSRQAGLSQATVQVSLTGLKS